MKLVVQPEVFSIVKLAPDAEMPDVRGMNWYTITRTPDELSIVAPKEYLEKLGLSPQGEWKCISFAQTYDLLVIGIAAAFTKPLADAGIPVFIVSSYNTDHVLVPRARSVEAVEILEKVEL